MLAIPPVISKDALRARLLSSLPDTLARLFPEGASRGRQFVVGDVEGGAGESLQIELCGAKAGLWHDFATGEGGDVFDLFAAQFRMGSGYAFTDLLQRIETWLGNPPPLQVTKTSSQTKPKHISKFRPKLPAPTCHWTYTDAAGNAVARVFRYDTDGKKQFRPYDLIEGRWGAPTIRPLYNLPAVIAADTIILVEGEKCAQALIDRGIVATTAMFGANAPTDKTDWTPLIGKRVIIWPDNDSSGQNYARTLTQTLTALGVVSVRLLSPPPNKPPTWDAADAVSEGFDIEEFLISPPVAFPSSIPSFSLQDYLADQTPTPPDLIAPRILTPGGILVIGGAPKVGKSDFLLSLLVHMAAGKTFLGMTPPSPLRVFYLQAEIHHDYLRERIHHLHVYGDVVDQAGAHLMITPRLRLILNEQGVEDVIAVIQSCFAEQVDIIVIDPIRNVFDSTDGRNENDNSAMLSFLMDRVEPIRDAVNPKAGIILVHHTRKSSKGQFREDPFQALSGAGSLRSYYTSGMMLHCEDARHEERTLQFELRNGPPLANKSLRKENGQWIEKKKKRRALPHDRVHRGHMILHMIAEEALDGTLHTINTFCKLFEGDDGLGGFYALQEQIKLLSSSKHIQFAHAFPALGYPRGTSTLGYMIVKDMVFCDGDTRTPLYPTHIRAATNGKAIPIETPPEWPSNEGGVS